MSKRFMFMQQNGERKKPKLNVTISDHNFPLSQNPGPSKEPSQNVNWGDENDDEILLLASQACEDAYVNDISQLPDYSLCMQPPTTSTQLPQPSTSKDDFAFKMPVVANTNILKEKFGLTPKSTVPKRNDLNFSDDLIFNDKIYQGQDADYMYRQMLQLQEENAKLKSENGKLLEKCVTKEGEASILRTQLKTSQISVDNARLEKIRAQEKVQMEWNEKLTAANLQAQDLKNQLDFKNLEIISVKERCKMLESNKVKLTQVNIPANDISSSQRLDHSTQHEFRALKRVRVACSAAQTEARALTLPLNKVYRAEPSKLKELLPLALQPTTTDAFSILYSSETLHRPPDYTENRCQMYSTVHRITAATPAQPTVRVRRNMSCLHGDLARLAGEGDSRCCANIISVVAGVLHDVCTELESVSTRVTSSFRREMDERYVDATATYRQIERRELLGGESLYKEEQAILARRMTAVLGYIVESAPRRDIVPLLIETTYSEGAHERDKGGCSVLEYICRICRLVDSNSCGILYSGLLLSIIILLEALLRKDWFIRIAVETCVLSTKSKTIIDLIQCVITSRPLPVVTCQLISFLRKYVPYDTELKAKLCSGSVTGNLKTDYEQGVLLYKKDSCYLQVFLKEIEAALKCIERQELIDEAAKTTNSLIAFYSNLNIENSSQENRRCDCRLVMSQVLVFALQMCAVMLHTRTETLDDVQSHQLSAICRSGIILLYQSVLQDAEFPSRLAYTEGHYHAFVEACDRMRGALACGDVHGNLLSGLVSTVQPPAEDGAPPTATTTTTTTTTQHRHAWVDSFSSFSLAD